MATWLVKVEKHSFDPSDNIMEDKDGDDDEDRKDDFKDDIETTAVGMNEGKNDIDMTNDQCKGLNSKSDDEKESTVVQ